MTTSNIQELPTNEQELFEFAIKQSASVNAEFGGYSDALILRAWALRYAPAHGLTIAAGSKLDELCGIYYTPDESDIENLKKMGLWDTK